MFRKVRKIGLAKWKMVDVYRKNKEMVAFEKNMFLNFTIDKLDIGDIIRTITMIFATRKKVLGHDQDTSEVDRRMLKYNQRLLVAIQHFSELRGVFYFIACTGQSMEM